MALMTEMTEKKLQLVWSAPEQQPDHTAAITMLRYIVAEIENTDPLAACLLRSAILSLEATSAGTRTPADKGDDYSI